MYAIRSYYEDKSQGIIEISASDIAVIGISLNLPNAETTEEFWSNLTQSKDSINEFPDSRRKDTRNNFV